MIWLSLAWGSPQDEILEVSKRFHDAMAAKDAEAMMSTFDDPDRVPMVGSYAAWTREPPLETSVRAWFGAIEKMSGEVEETVDNVDIEVAGGVASMRFDFRFLRNGDEAVHGREFWTLKNAGDGWKIVSIGFNMEPSHERREPAVVKPKKLERLAGTYEGDLGTWVVRAEENCLAIDDGKQTVYWQPTDATHFFRHAHAEFTLSVEDSDTLSVGWGGDYPDSVMQRLP